MTNSTNTTKLGRSKRLEEFRISLGINKDLEVYSINHPTEDDDRRDFQYGKYRVTLTISEGKYLGYQFNYEKFLNSSLTGLSLSSFKRVLKVESEIDECQKVIFYMNKNFFEKELAKLTNKPFYAKILDRLNFKRA